MLRVGVIMIKRINKIISSKIRKIILIEKNCILKDKRLWEIESNAHSKGDIFS